MEMHAFNTKFACLQSFDHGLCLGGGAGFPRARAHARTHTHTHTHTHRDRSHAFQEPDVYVRP